MEGPEVKLEVGTKPGLKFDKEEIVVPRYSKVQITFKNDDDMLHNMVIINTGQVPSKNADTVAQEALELGLEGEKLNYVPDSELVLYHTGILQPDTTEDIFFQAPKRRGTYWIICSFPGHGNIMRMKMIVE